MVDEIGNLGSIFRRICAWLMRTSEPEAEEIRSLLASSLLGRPVTILASTGIGCLAAILVWCLSGAVWAVVWFGLEIALGGIRLFTIRHALHDQRADQAIIFRTMIGAGLSWAAMAGTFSAICMASSNFGLPVIAAIASAGYAGGTSSRNAATPRYAITIISLIMIPCAIGALFSSSPAIRAVALLIPFWMLATVSILYQNHRVLLRMMRSERVNYQLAHTDSLTGLGNRALFGSKLESLCGQASRRERTFALLMIDLDGFKAVNDQHGHGAGDHLLMEVANRLVQSVRDDDVVCRLGGDEFVILLDLCSTVDVNQIARRIVSNISLPIRVPSGQQVRVGASIGIAIAPDEQCDALPLVEMADDRLYAFKRQRKASSAGPDFPVWESKKDGHKRLTQHDCDDRTPMSPMANGARGRG